MTKEEATTYIKEWLKDEYLDGKDREVLTAIIEESEQKSGHWIASDISNEKYVCSECGGACWYYDHEGDVEKSRYCPNCGAKMEVEK